MPGSGMTSVVASSISLVASSSGVRSPSLPKAIAAPPEEKLKKIFVKKKLSEINPDTVD